MPIVKQNQGQISALSSLISTFSSSLSQSSPVLPSTNDSSYLPLMTIIHKTLPFYDTIACIYKRYHIFHYDTHRKKYTSHDEFI